jgi:hypothetical protein
MTQFALIDGAYEPGNEYGLRKKEVSELGAPFRDVARTYRATHPWIPVGPAGQTSAFDDLVIEAQNAGVDGIAATRLVHFLEEVAAQRCSIVLWYANDYAELPELHDVESFIAAVSAGIASPSAEIYAILRAR